MRYYLQRKRPPVFQLPPLLLVSPVPMARPTRIMAVADKRLHQKLIAEK